MENIKKLNALIERAVSDGHESIPPELNKSILEVIQSRVDMPKHAIAAISKRMIMKNKKLLINAFNLLEFISYECQLSLYSQIATKEFLFKISGLLMNKDVDPDVKTKIMQTIYCWQELFRPHEDLVPLFFQFYAGVLRQEFAVPHGYVSPFRPAQLKQYKKKQQKTYEKQVKSSKSIPLPSKTEMKTFEEIREKLILTNQIIDNANPGENVKENDLLLEMIDTIKECEKKVNTTINENPNQKMMQIALAVNDDIFITYRRYKDLQRNKKPEPFILTELVSDVMKEQELKKNVGYHSMQESIRGSEKKEEKIQSPKKEQKPKKAVDILDLDYQPEKKEPVNTTGSQNIFDLLGQPSVPVNTNPNPNPNTFETNQDLLGTGSGMQSVPPPSGNGITLNLNQFKTESDMKQYDDRNPIEKLTDLTDLRDFMKK